jgi:uncharacterized protein Yka (UPF0111/DUF47 family)
VDVLSQGPTLLELVRMQDKMANDTKDVAGLSLGRELAFPAKLEKSLFKYLAAITDCANQAVEVIVALRELSRSAFGSRQVDAYCQDGHDGREGRAQI